MFLMLKDVVMPKSLKEINIKVFANCNRLERILIPENVVFVSQSAFQECLNLKVAKCPLLFLSSLPKKQILELEITECKKPITSHDLKDFKYLQTLIVPKNVVELPKDTFKLCPRLEELSCALKLLENMDQHQKLHLKTIHFPFEENIQKDVVNNLQSIYDIKVKYGTAMPLIDRNKKH